MPDMEIIILRLIMAVAIGGLVGFEREYSSKDAGFRTLILISLGSALFTMFSLFIANEDTDRIASNIVTGIGFLGAGVIFKYDNRIKGLTTAATIWVTAALGMGAGAGYYWITLSGAGLTLIALFFFTRLEAVIERTNQSRAYRIVCVYREGVLLGFEEKFRSYGLKFKRDKQFRKKNEITGSWIVTGTETNHEAFIEEILNHPDILEFDF